MALERVMASAKLDRENAEFLDEIAANFEPYEISQSSLMNTLLHVLRHMYRRGDINLEPSALQKILRTERIQQSLPGRQKLGGER